jgi:hypothetical protein
MNKEIIIRETAGIPRTAEYLRVAVPFARGEILAAFRRSQGFTVACTGQGC